jgi:3-keto-L-gulonate-6-phosphate decarboxylase
VHSGLDRQESRHSPLSELESVSHVKTRLRLAIAGGIQLSDIPNLLTYPLDIIIIGGSITRAKYPEKVAEMFYNAVNQ